jgi:hypothetical protein
MNHAHPITLPSIPGQTTGKSVEAVIDGVYDVIVHMQERCCGRLLRREYFSERRKEIDSRCSFWEKAGTRYLLPANCCLGECEMGYFVPANCWFYFV